MGFFSDLFGGPTKQQEGLTSRADTLAATMQQNYLQQFGAQSAIQQNLSNQLTPIANLGPNQQGFSPQELASLNTQAINESVAAARNAQIATSGVLAGQGGGSASAVASGIQQQIAGTEASAAANQLASAQEAITQKNYDVGRSNFWNATQGEHALATTYDPSAYGKEAGTKTQSALGDANQIQQERQAAAFATIALGMKALGAATSFATGGLGNLDTTGSSSFGEQAGNFFSGGLGALAGA